ncbi:ubiquinone biosynthesis O-methyltransferase, mitochondrial-like [Musca autumnalis]|uniref:ubiquinone biosynthesis O-methyltransferase, mitochondrial-like n=1 Tax=Musca autumnalis TaxID=221902 RepID=UPI003CFA4F2D
MSNKQNLLENQKILEIGCGGGILTEDLARLEANITALDLSENMIAIARQHLLNDAQLAAAANRIQYKIESIEEHASDIKNCYDAVVISEVLEHIDEKMEFLTASLDTLKPGGSVFITTLNKTFSMWLVGLAFGEYIHRSVPIGTHHYGKMISPQDVERMLYMSLPKIKSKQSNFELCHDNMSHQLLKKLLPVLEQSNRIQCSFLGTIPPTRMLQTNSNKQKSVSTTKAFNLSEPTQSEVIHHSNLSTDWWHVNGPVRALHSLNKLRVPFICEGLASQGKISPSVMASDILKNQQILEIGCGGGILTENLANLGANVTGLDLSEDLITIAQEHLSQQANHELPKRIEYKIEPIELHVTDKQQFYDAVVISEVLEHIDDKVGFLKASVDAVKPGGSIFITTLNKTMTMWVVGVLIGEYILQAIPIGTHHYGKMISPANVERMLKTLNCDTVLVKGSSYNFLRNSWRWRNSTSTFYALHAVKRMQ